MTTMRALAAGAAVMLALLLQVSLLPHLAWQGVVPNLALLVVVGAALTQGPQFAMVLGFAAGALVDLAPPADHTAGRWALALTVVGYVAGRVRSEADPSATTVVGTVAASSFVGTSIFAITGLVLGELVHPYWRFLSAFAGLNLLQAAFTGFCPAALIFKALGLKPGAAFCSRA